VQPPTVDLESGVLRCDHRMQVAWKKWLQVENAAATECRPARSDEMAGPLCWAVPRKVPRAVGQRGRRLGLRGADGADPCLVQLSSSP
jgi:hypothetical protein